MEPFPNYQHLLNIVSGQDRASGDTVTPAAQVVV